MSRTYHAQGVLFSEYQQVEYALTIDRPFKKIPKNDSTMAFIRENAAVEFRHIQNGEIGFVYSANELTIHIWSGCMWTRVKECEKAPIFLQGRTVSYPFKNREARIFITGMRIDEYFARPILLDKAYKERIVEWADVLLCKIENRPRCEMCGAFMGIRQKKNRATFWACTGISFPHMPIWKDWDFALPFELKEKVFARRKEARRLAAMAAR